MYIVCISYSIPPCTPCTPCIADLDEGINDGGESECGMDPGEDGNETNIVEGGEDSHRREVPTLLCDKRLNATRKAGKAGKTGKAGKAGKTEKETAGRRQKDGEGRRRTGKGRRREVTYIRTT